MRTSSQRPRRVRLFAVATLVIGLLTAACAPTGGSGSQQTTPAPAAPPSSGAPAGSGTAALSGEVEWWTINLQKNYADYINGMITAYQNAHPGVTIKWVDVAGADVAQKYLAAVAANTLPDAVNLTSAQVGAFRSTLTDLNSLLSSDQMAVYEPSLVHALESADGAVSAVPWYNGGALINYYRMSVVGPTGFKVDAPPATYADALKLAADVQSSADIYGTNIAFFWAVPAYYDIPMLSPDKSKAAFNTPELATVLDSLKAAYDSGALAPGTVGDNWREYPESVANAQIGFDFAQYATNLAGIEKNAPDVYSDLGVSLAPKTPSGKYVMNGMQTFAVPAGSDNKQTAADWIAFVTNPENQLAFCKIVAIFPSTSATLKDPFFASPQGAAPMDVARQLIAASAADVVDITLGTSHDEELQKAFEENVRAVLLGDKSSTDALADAEAQWNTILSS